MSQKIVVKFNPKTGEIKKETSGFQGDECQTKTQGLDDSLGITGSACSLKPEWFETKAEEQQEIGGA